MKEVKRHIALALAALMLIGTMAACGKSGVTDIHNPADAVSSAQPEDSIMELSWEMVPLTQAPPVSSILTPTAPGTLTKSNQKAAIDYSNTADGYVMIKYLQTTTKELRVRVTGPNSVKYDYRLKSSGEYEVFPLSAGNGSYTIAVFEQIEGSRYATANSVTATVTLKDEFAPFLRPNQYVNFKEDSAVVKKAAELVKGVDDFYGKVAAVFNFITSTIKYDKDFAAAVGRGEHAGYVPVLDTVLANKKGICFDFAAVMTGMLRSQSIPTRLVIGYAGQAYHAWIEVYSEKDGWVSTIQFDGKSWKLMDPTFMSSATNAAQTEEVMKYIGDGSKYTACYLY